MIPAPKQHGLDYSIITEKVKKKNVKSLCASVIYGPNASGKTNIIGAMDTFRAIVLRGNIRNAEDQNTPNKAAYNLELIPNNIEPNRPPGTMAVVVLLKYLRLSLAEAVFFLYSFSRQ